MDIQSWLKLMQNLHTTPKQQLYNQLLCAYSQPQRYYHTVLHIQECLHIFEQVYTLAMRPVDIELALWFHDAIYQPGDLNNELNSANWALQFLKSIEAPQPQSHHVFELILATTHQEDIQTGDSQLITDIDLAILGSNPERYFEFEQAIRQEYAHVSKPIYCQKRVKFLNSLLKRSSIYNTEYFKSCYESQARINLQAALTSLI